MSNASIRSDILAGIRGGSPGPQGFLRKAPVDLYAAKQQKDPYIAALEARYAQQVADAQTGVNEALLNGGDFIYGSPRQTSAKMDRALLMRRAAEQYNQRLAPNDPRRKDVMISTRFGA